MLFPSLFVSSRLNLVLLYGRVRFDASKLAVCSLERTKLLEVPGSAHSELMPHPILWTEKMIVVLRDGRTLIGILRSVDQFANLVLHRTIERIHVGREYGDIPRGVFIVRGENVALLGEIVSVLIWADPFLGWFVAT